MKNIVISLLVFLVLAVTSKGQEGWRKVNVYPNCSDLNAIDSYAEFVVAVGELGVIRYSHDFGKRWETYQADKMETFLDIAMYDENSAIAVGYQGMVYVTTDRSKTWKEVNLNTSEYLNNIQYYGEMYGIICGSNGTLYESNGDLAEWEKIESHTTNKLNQGIIFDKENAIICGDNGTLLLKNQGKDWELIDLGTDADLERIVKYNKNTAFLVTSDFKGYYSTDRGLNWNQVTIDAKYGDEVRYITFMEVWDDNVVIHTSHGKIGRMAIEYVSSDLKNWNYINKGTFENGSGTNDVVKLLGKTSGIGVCTMGRLLNVSLSNYDGLKNTPLYSGPFIVEMQSISAIDEQNYVIVSRQSPTCMYTSDAGKSWETNYINLGMANFTGIKAFSPENIFVGGDFTWSQTDSSGVTSIYEEPLFYKIDKFGNIQEDQMLEMGEGVSDFCFLNKNYGVMSAMSGFNLTKDGGETWEYIRRPVPRLYIDEIEMPELGYIVTLEHCFSSDTTLFSISEDFGETWTEKTSPARFTGFKAIDKQTFIASYMERVSKEYTPHIYLTTDAGDSWKELDLGGFKFNSSYVASYAYNMDNGKLMIVLGSYYGKILTSEDLGETWTSTDLGFDPNMDLGVQAIEYVNHKPIIMFKSNLILVSDEISEVAEENTESIELTVYPNPADKLLNIKTKTVEIDEIKIYSTELRLVKEFSFSNGHQQADIDIEDLSTGSYLIVIKDKNNNLVSKRFNIVR